MTTLLWLRRALRLTDNPALAAALADGGAVVPVFVLDEGDSGRQALGGASRWWLHQSLSALAEAIEARSNRLILRRGPAEAVIPDLLAETGAGAVSWDRRHEPWARIRDERLERALAARGIAVRGVNAALLREPWELATRKGDPYRVFTPFRKALRAEGAPPFPTPAPKRIARPETFPASDDLAAWALTPTAPDWAGGLRATWSPGEDGALSRLDEFLDGPLAAYDAGRDLPGVAGTSRLSPHLHFGEIGPRQVWHAVVARAAAAGGGGTAGTETFLSELAWREFSHHLLFHFPSMSDRPLRPEFAAFPWIDDGAALAAWRRGRTGFPIVDAGMRELWATGWMHNRARMIVASFLVKDLLIDWRRGEEWFRDTLVDADPANNVANWQWVAGCGADAAPYFRIFNPVLQGARFDRDGTYVRRWVPELAALPDGVLHAPWTARPEELGKAGVVLGRTYPRPIVDHGRARLRALAAHRRLTGGGRATSSPFE